MSGIRGITKIFLSCLVIYFLESRLNHTISFHGGDHDIEDPEEDEESWWNCLEEFGAAELSTNSRMSPGQEDQDGAGGLDTEHRHGESQAASRTVYLSFQLPIVITFQREQ